MTAYQAPIDDMRFVINELAGLDDITGLEGMGEVTPDLVDAILDEAGKLGSEVLAPLNRPGDIEGCTLENGVVRTPKGFPEAYARFIEGGWNGVPFEAEYGGQGLPWLLQTATFEIWHAANMAFTLCPMLNQGAAELLTTHGSEALKSVFLKRLVSGQWSGTMDMTEPQAGSDLSKVQTKSVKAGDHYRITGQKIFITHGEQDLSQNILHMVLARSPDGAEGIKGLSLFLVPKFLVNEDGTLGDRNDMRCLSLEHKLGIHASPTCVMAYGEDGGATGYLIGEENKGIECMFTMMNTTRLAIGLEGVGIAERAYQHARQYAGERVQGRAPGGSGGAEAGSVTIDRHPDVRRMLLSMRAQTEAIRALAYFVAAAMDTAKRHPDGEIRRQKQGLVDLLTPVVKAWSSDTGIEVANTCIQVLGGAGFIEESGAPQFLRDVRIAAIYEGTNGIQANDLINRKVAREKGVSAKAQIATMRELLDSLAGAGSKDLSAIGDVLSKGIDALEGATDWIVATHARDTEAIAAGAVPYLRLMGVVTGGWLMAKAALVAESRLAAGGDDKPFLADKIVTARFYADQILVQAEALGLTVTEGWSAVARFPGADE